MLNSKNTKVLTKEELDYVNSIYKFKLIDGYIIVQSKSGNLELAHSIHKSFILNTKIRKITFTTKTFDYWKTLQEYSLVDVQNAINTLVITYQDVNRENILNILRKGK